MKPRLASRRGDGYKPAAEAAMNLETSRQILAYSDWANTLVLAAAETLADAQLDQPFDMGCGSLRRTLLHTYAGEFVWLQRWQGRIETRWVNEDEAASVEEMRARFRRAWGERDEFLATLKDDDLPRIQEYRDSKGSLYRASLGDMMLQMYLHSTHHRAQAANMLRRLGAGPVDLDYMYWRRKPAG